MNVAQSKLRFNDPEQKIATEIGALGPANLKSFVFGVVQDR